MDETDSFDPARLGLESHYSPAHQQRIRRLILEDWKKSGVKLPTYMKLVARYIERIGVPEAWLGQLIHQTMDKMLKGTSTPRHEFWACLHLYLLRKYGPEAAQAPPPGELDELGRALARFAEEARVPEEASGMFSVSEKPHMAVVIRTDASGTHARVAALYRAQREEMFADSVTVTLKGAVVANGDGVAGILRETGTRTLLPIDLPLDRLKPEDDGTMRAKLEALDDAP